MKRGRKVHKWVDTTWWGTVLVKCSLDVIEQFASKRWKDVNCKNCLRRKGERG